MLVSSNFISFLLLLFIVAVFSRPNNFNQNETTNELSSDSSNTAATQLSENVVELVGRGPPVELILLNGFLDVQIDLKNCFGR